jgi:purine nucleosidase
MPRKIIIDTDPGIDDAVALTMALFDPRIEVVAITAAAGNVDHEQATRNAQSVIDQLDPPRLPRLGAANEAETGMPIDSLHLFGSDGLGEANFPVAELHNKSTSDKVLQDTVKASPEEISVLCLAPLTNVALAMGRDPDWASLIDQLVILGGSITAPGNVTSVAEFNIYCDPPAARRVLTSRTTKTLIPLDVTQRLIFSYDLLNQLPSESTRAGRFLRKILPYTFRAHRQILGVEGVFLHEAIALVAMLEPELFTWEDMSCDVEITGELTLGMTVFDRRSRTSAQDNMTVAVDYKPEVSRRVVDLIQAAGRATAD